MQYFNAAIYLCSVYLPVPTAVLTGQETFPSNAFFSVFTGYVHSQII